MLKKRAIQFQIGFIIEKIMFSNDTRLQNRPILVSWIQAAGSEVTKSA